MIEKHGFSPLETVKLRKWRRAVAELRRGLPVLPGDVESAEFAASVPQPASPSTLASGAGGAAVADALFHTTSTDANPNDECSSAQARSQLIRLMSEVIQNSPELCEDDLGWQLVRQALPDARQFFDVGANLGCAASTRASAGMHALACEKPPLRVHAWWQVHCDAGLRAVEPRRQLHGDRPGGANNVDGLFAPAWLVHRWDGAACRTGMSEFSQRLRPVCKH